ncbi:unnamed protein product [Penicillium salamii]|nr:unnamed protein product [Penicillium salamii]
MAPITKQDQNGQRNRHLQPIPDPHGSSLQGPLPAQQHKRQPKSPPRNRTRRAKHPTPLPNLPRPPQHPPAPLPLNPKRSAQISKLRDSANTAYRKSNYDEAIKLYTYAIEMGLARPGWEPVGVAREELAGLYGNRAQAFMAQQAWPEGLVDAKASVDSKPVGNVKAWWRIAKSLAEMGRYEESRKFLHKGLDLEGKESEGGKELFGLLEEVERALLRALKA